MNRQEAIADGVATFISMMVALMGALLPIASFHEAIFLSFLASLYGSSALVLAHRVALVSLKHILISDAILMSSGLLLYLLQNPLGGWAALPYAIIIGMPFLACPLAGPRPPPKVRKLDARLLGLAVRYGGVLTKALVVSELGLSLEEAEVLLARFCRHGEAREVPKGQVVLYVFPSAQASLSRAELKIVEALMGDLGGMSRDELLNATGLAPDELDNALLELSMRGAIHFSLSSGEYKLSCLSPPGKPRTRPKPKPRGGQRRGRSRGKRRARPVPRAL